MKLRDDGTYVLTPYEALEVFKSTVPSHVCFYYQTLEYDGWFCCYCGREKPKPAPVEFAEGEARAVTPEYMAELEDSSGFSTAESQAEYYKGVAEGRFF